MFDISRSGRIILFLGLIAGFQPASAQSSDPAWLDALNLQLLIEKDCEVLFYMHMREGTLGAMRTQEARVQCLDGRQFDAERIEPAEDFKIEQCETQVC